MKRFFCVAAIGAAALAFVPIARGQQAVSPSYVLVDYGWDCGGGGSCSIGFAGWLSIGGMAGGPNASTQFDGVEGVLANVNPATGNDPKVFGVTPAFGPKAGGQRITVSGLNFDKFGSGPTVSASIGGVPCTDVQVLSNTTLTAVTPVGQPGPRTVTVTNTFGSSDLFNGFINTPAIQTTSVVQLGDTLHIVNYGPVGATYRTFVSTSQWFAPTGFGPVLIGPVPFVELLTNLPYPMPDGVDDIALFVPPVPLLHGLIVHFQTFAQTSVSPIDGSLTNSSTTAIQ